VGVESRGRPAKPRGRASGVGSIRSSASREARNGSGSWLWSGPFGGVATSLCGCFGVLEGIPRAEARLEARLGVRVCVERDGGVAGAGGEGGRDCGMGPGRVATEVRTDERFFESADMR